MAKRRIVWTPQERESIVEKSVKLLRQYPKMPIFHAVGQVQETLLPPARQRKWLTRATLGEMVKDIEARLNEVVEPIRLTVATSQAKNPYERAHEFANKQEEATLYKCQQLGIDMPKIETLQLLWATNFRAYMEAINDQP